MSKSRVTRRQAREVAMQVLFLYDQNPAANPELIRKYVEKELHFPKLEQFSLDLVEGVRLNRISIDAILAETASNWSVSRMPPVDRNILRIAVLELRFLKEAPPQVVINEAVEICKRFSTADSAAFVNGVLDRVAGLRKGPVTVPPPAEPAVELPPDAILEEVHQDDPTEE